MKLTRYDKPFLYKPKVQSPPQQKRPEPPADLRDVCEAAARVAGGNNALARKLGCSGGSISAWRKGKTVPKPETQQALRKIAGGEA